MKKVLFRINKKGFTLIELIAVVAILGIILAISVPVVSNLIAESKKKAFIINAQQVIKEIQATKLKNVNFDETQINIYNVQELIGISTDKYKAIYVANLLKPLDPDGDIQEPDPDKIFVYIVGKNDWEGFVVQGTFNDMHINNVDDCGDQKISNYFTGIDAAYDRTFVSGYEITDMQEGNFKGILIRYDDLGNIITKMSYGDDGTSGFFKVANVSNGVIGVGTDGDNYSSLDAVIVKYDLNGSLIWDKTFGGSEYEYFYDIVETTDGIVAAGSGGSIDGDMAGLNSTSGVDTAIIVKYDTNGNLVWKRSFNGTSDDSFDDMVAVADGYVAVGGSYSTDGDMTGLSKGNRDAIIVKYDLNGNLVWKKSFGGTNYDRFRSITATTGGYIAVGSSSSFDYDMTDINKGWEDIVVVKYDTNGNIVWKKTYGGTDDDWAERVTEVPGGYVFVGATYSPDLDMEGLNPDWDDIAIMFKIDTNGNIVWKKALGDSEKYEFGDLKTIDSSPIFISTISPTYYETFDFYGHMTKYDANGNQTNDIEYARVETVCREKAECTLAHLEDYQNIMTDIIEEGDGFVIAGSSGGESIFGMPTIVKYDKNGNVVWEAKPNLSLSYPYLISDIEKIPNGYVIAGIGIDGISNIIAKLDSTGKVVWKKEFSGTGDMFLKIIVNDTGYTTLSIDQDSEQGLLKKYDLNGNLIKTQSLDPSFLPIGLKLINNNYVIPGMKMDNETALIQRYDMNLNYVETITYSGSGLSEFYNIIDIGTGYIALGVGQTASETNPHGLVVKYGTDFTETASYVIRGASTGYYLKGIVQVADGFVISGAQASGELSHPVLIKINNSGSVIWEKTYDGFINDNNSFSDVVDLNGQYVALGGRSFSMLPSWNRVPSVVSYDTNGNITWGKAYGKDNLILRCTDDWSAMR